MTTAANNRDNAAHDAMRQNVYDRISFQLSYARDTTRKVWDGGIDGNPIPDAFGQGRTASGEWTDDEIGHATTPERTIKEAWTAALSEVIHECCEWFQVDGRALLNPHDPDLEDTIFDLSRSFADDLWDLVDPARVTAVTSRSAGGLRDCVELNSDEAPITMVRDDTGDTLVSTSEDRTFTDGS